MLGNCGVGIAPCAPTARAATADERAERRFDLPGGARRMVAPGAW